MSTRCNILIRSENQTIQLYRHCDGYPESVIPDLQEALPFAWDLPRFEADDFSAAIVRAWKKRGGGIYIDGKYVKHRTVHGDIDFLYVVEPPNGKMPVVKVYHSEREFLKGVPFWEGKIGDTYKGEK